MIGGRKSLGFMAIIITMLFIGQAHLAGATTGTAFTYQGRFSNGGTPANGAYDFQFTLYDAAAEGSQVGSTVNKEDIDVNDGYFTTTLDFGSGIFTGDARWLQIAVRLGTQTGSYTTLNPRHELTPVPYVINAATSGTAGRIAKFTDGSGLADSVMRESNGGIGIGTTTQHSNIQLDILGTNTADYAWPNLFIRTSNPPTAGAGGHITFGGKWQDTGDPVDDYTQWAGISGRKENGTSGEYGGYFTVTTRTHGSGGGAERLRITSTGNVGIGTSSPTHRLMVSADATGTWAMDPGNAQLVLTGATDDTLRLGLGVDTTNAVARIQAGDFGVAPLDLLLQPAGGDVAIGATDPLDAKLFVNGAAAGMAPNIRTAGDVVIGYAGAIFLDGVHTYSNSFIMPSAGYSSQGFFTSGVERIRITSGGNIGVGTTAPVQMLDVNGIVRCVSVQQTSDEQLKTDIEPLAGVLERLGQVRAVSFRWNQKAQALGAKTGERQIGVLAQELEQAFPELVSTPEPVSTDELINSYPEHALTPEVRQRLEKDAEATQYKAVNYSQLTVVLLEAVKELQARNESLEQRIRTLESKAQ